MTSASGFAAESAATRAAASSGPPGHAHVGERAGEEEGVERVFGRERRIVEHAGGLLQAPA